MFVRKEKEEVGQISKYRFQITNQIKKRKAWFFYKHMTKRSRTIENTSVDQIQTKRKTRPNIVSFSHIIIVANYQSIMSHRIIA